MCHLQIADVYVVQDYGTLERFVRIPSQFLELPGDVRNPAIGDPTHRAHRGRMIGVGKQGDLGAVCGPQFEGLWGGCTT